MKELPLGDRVRILMPDADEHLLTWAIRGKFYERELLDKIKSLTPPHSIFIDVGAQFGNHSLYFAVECQASLVVAIEPHPWTFRTLTDTIVLNHLESVIEPVCAFIHPEWRTASADWDEQDDKPWIRLLEPHITEGGVYLCMTLDRVIFASGADVIKIDAERASVDVLRSGINGIRSTRPLIAIEARNREEQAQVDALLTPLGYENLGDFQHMTPTFIWVPDAS